MTMDEIAKELGVSKTTVSRALSGKGRIGKATAERIREFAQQNGLPGKWAATRNIGVAIPADSYTTSIPYFHECLLGISGSAAMMRYNVMIVIDTPDDIGNICSLVENRLVDGIILMRCNKDDRALKYLTKRHFPVGLTGQCEYDEVVQVDVDNRKASETISSMLIEQGYRRFAIVTGSTGYKVNADRIAGFHDAISGHGLSWQAQNIYTNFLNSEQVDRIVDDCIIQKIECVICGDDVICTWLMSRLQTERMRIPQDISIVSLYNSSNLDCFSPAVTAVNVPAKRIGNAVARQLINCLSGNHYEPKSILDYEILFRQSSARGNRKAGL